MSRTSKPRQAPRGRPDPARTLTRAWRFAEALGGPVGEAIRDALAERLRRREGHRGTTHNKG